MNYKCYFLKKYDYYYYFILSDFNSTFCPAKWDTLLCWPPTPPGSVAQQSCPRNHYGYDYKRYAYRECWPNGTWYTHPKSQKDWSNYTTCVDQEDLEVSKQQFLLQFYNYEQLTCFASIFMLEAIPKIIKTDRDIWKWTLSDTELWQLIIRIQSFAELWTILFYTSIEIII